MRHHRLARCYDSQFITFGERWILLDLFFFSSRWHILTLYTDSFWSLPFKLTLCYSVSLINLDKDTVSVRAAVWGFPGLWQRKLEMPVWASFAPLPKFLTKKKQTKHLIYMDEKHLVHQWCWTPLFQSIFVQNTRRVWPTVFLAMSIFQHHIYFSLIVSQLNHKLSCLPFISATQLSGYLFEHRCWWNKGFRLTPTRYAAIKRCNNDVIIAIFTTISGKMYELCYHMSSHATLTEILTALVNI